MEDGTIVQNPMLANPNPGPQDNGDNEEEESFFSVPDGTEKRGKRRGNASAKKFRARVPTPTVTVSDDKVN